MASELTIPASVWCSSTAVESSIPATATTTRTETTTTTKHEDNCRSIVPKNSAVDSDDFRLNKIKAQHEQHEEYERQQQEKLSTRASLSFMGSALEETTAAVAAANPIPKHEGFDVPLLSNNKARSIKSDSAGPITGLAKSAAMDGSRSVAATTTNATQQGRIGIEPTSRDVLLIPGSDPGGSLVMVDLLQDMMRLECLLWNIKGIPVPATVTPQVIEACRKLAKVVTLGKPLELAGLKDVPRPFLRSQGRFLTYSEHSSSGVLFSVMGEEQVITILSELLLRELKKGLQGIQFMDTPFKEFKDMVERTLRDTINSDSSIVLVPDPRDAILLRRGASNIDKLYETHVGNKVVFNIIAQVVTTYTTTSEARVEAAINLLQGLQDATAVTYANAETSPGHSGTTTPLPTHGITLSPALLANNHKPRFLLRNIREDESVFWSVIDPADAALFALCLVFEVYLEKEVHLSPQSPKNSSLMVFKDTPTTLVEYSMVLPVENPTDDDVLFGRGGMTNAHPGNRRFRDVIALHRPDYIRALKMDKPGVARKIVKSIRRSGRFLKKGDDGNWYDVGDRTAAEKTSQGLRERSNSEKRQRSALREALRSIRRHDLNDSVEAPADDDDENHEEKSGGDDEKSENMEERSPKKLKTSTPPSAAGVSILNYVVANMGASLPLNMKDVTAHTPSPVRKNLEATMNDDGVGDNSNSNVEMITEGLPPNAVDEDGNILVTDYDILCGRGGLTNHHKGNKRFRDIVALHRPDYVRAPKIQKPSVARVIVRAIRNGDPPGRFLRKDEKSGRWVDIGDKKAAEKTSQALREKTNDERDKLRRDFVALGTNHNTNIMVPNTPNYSNSSDTAALARAVPTMVDSFALIEEASKIEDHGGQLPYPKEGVGAELIRKEPGGTTADGTPPVETNPEFGLSFAGGHLEPGAASSMRERSIAPSMESINGVTGTSIRGKAEPKSHLADSGHQDEAVEQTQEIVLAKAEEHSSDKLSSMLLGL